MSRSLLGSVSGEGSQVEVTRNKLGHWVHFKHFDEEGDLLVCALSISDKRVFSCKD